VREDSTKQEEPVLDELIEHPMKSEKKWEKILNKLAKELGGWKRD